MPPESLGLIVDWGGVLTTPVNDSFAVFVEREHLDPVVFQQTMRRMHDEPGSALHRVEVGAITRQDFEAELSACFRTLDGRPVPADGLLQRMFGHAGPNVAVRRIVTDARARGWSTALLSNSWGNRYDEADLTDLLGVVLLSERIGARKPQPEAYLAACAALDLEPSDCVFVDDLRRNALAAEALGMIGFQYRPGTEDDLDALMRDREQA
jgi:putative hydrolase of the HAD superfamily